MSTPLRTRLRTHLTVAMRERDRPSTNALRSVLAALDNAEAVPAGSWAVAGSEHVAGAVVGVGAGERPRRQLTPDEERAVVARELAEMRASAEQLLTAGQPDRAAELLRGAGAVDDALPR